MQVAPQKIPKPRIVTWRRVLLAVLLLVVLAIGGTAWMLRHLETPWLRERVKNAVRAQLHLDVDYRQASVGTGGLELRELALASAPEDRELAPELLHSDRVTLRWQLRDLLPGHTRRASAVVEGVALNVVIDTQGVTSLERLLALMPPTPEKPPTLPSQLFKALHEAPELGLALTIGGVRTRAVRRLVGGGDQHVYLGDVALTGTVQLGGARAGADLRLDGAHLQLETTGVVPDPQLKPVLDLLPWLAPLQDGTGVLPLTLATHAVLQDDRLALEADLATGANELLALELVLQPEPAKRGLTVNLRRVAVLSRLGMHAALFVDDAMTALDGAMALTATLPALHLRGLESPGGTLQGNAVGLHLALDPSRTVVESLDFVLDTPGVTLADARVGQVHAEAHGHLRGQTALSGDAVLSVATLSAHDVAGDVTATDARATAKWTVLPDGATLTVDAGVAALLVQTADGLRTATLKDLKPTLQLQTAGVAAALADPLAALRELTLTLSLAEAEVVTDGQKVAASGAEVRLVLPPVVRESATVLTVAQKIQISGAVARVRLPGGRELTDWVRAKLETADLRVVLDQPLASTGRVWLDVHGPVVLTGTLEKFRDALAWKLDFSALPKELVDLVQPPATARKLVKWSALTIAGHSQGKATHLTGLPLVTQETSLDVANLQMPRRADVRRLSITLKSDGQGLRQKAEFALNADILRMGPVKPGGQLAVTGHLDHDPASRHLALRLDAKGPHSLAAGLDLEGRAQGSDLTYTVQAQARNIAAFLHAMAAKDRGALCLLDPKLGVKLDAKGTLTGGAQLFHQKPPSGIDGHHTVTLALTALSCQMPQGSARLPKLDVTADATWAKGAGKADVHVTLPNLEAAASGHAVRLDGLDQRLSVELRVDGTMHLAGDGKLSRLTQDAMPGVPLRDLSWMARGWSGAEGARLEQFQLDNPPTGTRLTLSGGLDRALLRPPKVTDADVAGSVPASLAGSTATDTTEPVPGRLGLNITGELRQDLGALAHDNAEVTAHGVVSVPIYLESGDLVVFHVAARVHFEHVDVGLTKPGLQVSDVFGDMPLGETFALTPQFQLLGGGEDDAYARWRFAEHQPFLRRTDFLTIGKIRYGGAEMGPVAGNASVDRDVFRMDQLEATLLHGQVTGQCMVLVNGEDTHIQLRGNATGLRVEGSDERFDANAALDFLPVRRALDGRAEILHIGRKHLEALLNLWDPYAEDAQSNRLRTVLEFGHPQRVRLRFLHGFMDVAVELGGLSSVVQIDELRGIALGPVFQRWLDPLLEPLRNLRVREAPKP